MHLTDAQRLRTVLRTDAGFGSDANIDAVLRAGWQVLTKNKGGRRPDSWARRVAESAWHSLPGDRQIAAVPEALTYCRPTQAHVLRWQTSQGLTKHAILIASQLDWSVTDLMAYYDARGQCEKEIQGDKLGLQLEHRRKKHLAAQEALVLLTDVAHNLLAWLPRWLSPPADWAQFGSLRLTKDILCLPGHLLFAGERLVEVQLNAAHPYAAEVALGLEHLLAHFGQP